MSVLIDRVCVCMCVCVCVCVCVHCSLSYGGNLTIAIHPCIACTLYSMCCHIHVACAPNNTFTTWGGGGGGAGFADLHVTGIAFV